MYLLHNLFVAQLQMLTLNSVWNMDQFWILPYNLRGRVLFYDGGEPRQGSESVSDYYALKQFLLSSGEDVAAAAEGGGGEVNEPGRGGVSSSPSGVEGLIFPPGGLGRGGGGGTHHDL